MTYFRFSVKTKLTMFSQNLLRCNRWKLWTHHACLAYSARVINLLYALATALRHDTHLATAYFSSKKGNRAIVQNEWDQKCMVNGNKLHGRCHWIEQITNVTWHSMNQLRKKDLFSCYIRFCTLRVREISLKTTVVFHVNCNFEFGYKCWTSILASNCCLATETTSKMAYTIYQKSRRLFVKKLRTLCSSNHSIIFKFS